ncbi:hypothetical protein [Haladaptatus halobius]|nr:hypothetical protein [Haladaptatus halobius]
MISATETKRYHTESGVTVETSFDGEEFAVPAIQFELRSDRDDEVTV